MLAVDFGMTRIRLVEGSLGKNGLRLVRADAIEYPENFDRDDASAVGDLLKTYLVENRVRARRAVTCVERRNLVLKTVDVGGVAEKELPEFVRLQAARDLTMPIDEAVCDYLRAPEAIAGAEARVLLAVARRDVVDFHRKVMDRAGLKLVGVWPSPLANALAARAALSPQDPFTEKDDGLDMLVIEDGESLELSLLHGASLLMTVARRSGRAEGQSRAQSLRRLGSSLSAQFPGLSEARVLVAGVDSANPTLVEEIREQFETTPRFFDPLVSVPNCPLAPEKRSRFAGAVGSLLAPGLDPERRIDFLSPKEPAPEVDRRRWMALAGVGVLLLALQQSRAYFFSRKGELYDDYRSAKRKQQKYDAEYRQLQAFRAQAATVEAWSKGELVWLDVLEDLHRRLPDVRDAFLTSMNASRSTRSRGPAAIVRIDGFARTQRTITDLARRLNASERFEARMGAIQPSGRYPGYEWRFSADISVMRDQPPDDPA